MYLLQSSQKLSREYFRQHILATQSEMFATYILLHFKHATPNNQLLSTKCRHEYLDISKIQ